jgi:hypothetical protein
MKAMSKEVFLYNTTEEELFCLLHEFKVRLNELYEEEGKEEFIISDKDISVVSESMITAIKGSAWLK